MNPVDGWFKNIYPIQNFTAAAGQSTAGKFPYRNSIPILIMQLFIELLQKQANVSDGEEAAIPVVTNRMLVTETMPLPMSGDGTKEFQI